MHRDQTSQFDNPDAWDYASQLQTETFPPTAPRQEDVDLDEYLASLDAMLLSVRTKNQGYLNQAHRNAIRAKLEQGIERLNREPPPRQIGIWRMEHRLTVPAASVAPQQDAKRALALSNSPTESTYTYATIKHLFEASACAIKRSPLPDQVRLLVRMVGAVLHYVEQRLGVRRNVSTWLLQSASGMIRFIHAHNIHVLVFRAMLMTLESFFAAIRAYQAESPPVA
ncbi:hypothetical protein MBRA1_000567 [Malassezia brasiliensis]|uniref:Uncharacterized protein n=1 Tax=Malassezia brasiliensis TaxID=1821822 RepID=A0AAF0DSH1_9BASI|nr:hypothetical protein MBRA1_000567 [Malassezia brasiliensis]